MSRHAQNSRTARAPQKSPRLPPRSPPPSPIPVYENAYQILEIDNGGLQQVCSSLHGSDRLCMEACMHGKTDGEQGADIQRVRLPFRFTIVNFYLGACLALICAAEVC